MVIVICAFFNKMLSQYFFIVIERDYHLKEKPLHTCIFILSDDNTRENILCKPYSEIKVFTHIYNF